MLLANHFVKPCGAIFSCRYNKILHRRKIEFKRQLAMEIFSAEAFYPDKYFKKSGSTLSLIANQFFVM